MNQEATKALFLVYKHILSQLMIFDNNGLDRVQVSLIVKEAVKRTEEELATGNKVT